MSTCGSPGCARAARAARGRRCSVCGPNTTSTYGARSTIAAPSWLATQPPTPISTPACALQVLDAAEVGEHLLLRLLAHRAGVEQDQVGLLGVGRSARSPRRRAARRPSCPSRTRSSGSRRCGGRAWPLALRRLPRGVRIHTWRTDALLRRARYFTCAPGGHGGRHDQAVGLRRGSARRARGARYAVDRHDRLLHVPDLAALRLPGMLRSCALRARRERGKGRPERSGKPHLTILPAGKRGEWWRIRDSNPGHTDYDSAALTS